MGWLFGAWMGASAGRWGGGCAGAVVLASIAALSCAICLLRAANSSWCDLERSEVLLDPSVVSTRGLVQLVQGGFAVCV